MEYNVIFIAGPQGSGKGTQGKKLAEKLGFLFWEMGGTLRRILGEDGVLAKKISAIDHGTLLSDELIIEVLKDQLPSVPLDRGIIFDGVPRRLGQGQFLVEYLKEQGRNDMATIFIDLPRDECVRRLLLRAKHETRMDDTPVAIATRFRDYDEAMKPAMDYLKEQTKFITVDGMASPDDVAASINKSLGIDGQAV
jgi:adenylate kinase